MMRRMLLGLALLACATMAQASATVTRTEMGAKPLEAFWSYALGDTFSVGDTLVVEGDTLVVTFAASADTLPARGLLSVAAAQDTCGPVWVADAKSTHLAVGAAGSDSVSVIAETSIDRVNWVAISNVTATNVDCDPYAFAYTNTIGLLTNATAGAVKGSATVTGLASWVRMRILNNAVTGHATSVSARISCVRS